MESLLLILFVCVSFSHFRHYFYLSTSVFFQLAESVQIKPPEPQSFTVSVQKVSERACDWSMWALRSGAPVSRWAEQIDRETLYGPFRTLLCWNTPWFCLKRLPMLCSNFACLQFAFAFCRFHNYTLGTQFNKSEGLLLNQNSNFIPLILTAS